MKTEIFERDGIFIGDRTDNLSSFDNPDGINVDKYRVHLKSARDRMLLMKAEFAVVIMNSTTAWIIKNIQNGKLGKVSSDDFPEYFI